MAELTKKQKSAYFTQKSQAKQRGIEFNLTLLEWYFWWVQSGKFHLRGKGADQYCMARFKDAGSYNLNNIKCITNRENASEVRKNKPDMVRSPPNSKPPKVKNTPEETKRLRQLAHTGKVKDQATKDAISKSMKGNTNGFKPVKDSPPIEVKLTAAEKKAKADKARRIECRKIYDEKKKSQRPSI